MHPDRPGWPTVNEPDQTAASMLDRKLVTVLSADVAEYSRLMADDEEQTLRTFRDYSQTFRALVDMHHGRIFNTAGDAILAEFTSPVEAVRCATDIQAALRTRNDQLPLTRQVKFRIGVNLGDVMVQNSDLLGDGVNVAARLQGAAAPGGICISGSVYDQIRNKLSLGFESLGEVRFKNIPQPVRTFTVATDDDGQLPPSRTSSRRPGVTAKSTVAALSLLVLAGGYWAYSTYQKNSTDQFSAPPDSRRKAGAVPGASAAVKKIDSGKARSIPDPIGTVKKIDAKDAATPAAETPLQVRSGSAAHSDISRLMRNEEVSNDKCIGGFGDLEERGSACAERDRLVEVLANRGWCYEKSWQRCAQ